MQDILASHRKNNFDFLRLFAAMGILVSHVYLLSLGSEAGDPFFHLTGFSPGRLFVYIFFLISGYLVTESYLRRPQNFVRNRALRIWPGLVVNILIAIFVIGPLVTSLSLAEYFQNSATYKYFYNLIFVLDMELPGVFRNNRYNWVNGSIWTLSSEVMMYLTIWLIGALKLDFRKAVPVLFVIFVALFLSGHDKNIINKNHLEIRILPEWDFATYFFVGAMFNIFKTRINYRFYIVCLLAALAIILTHYISIIAGIFVFLPYTLFYITFCPRIKLSKASKFGDLSYGIYLYSSPIQQMILFYFSNQLGLGGLFILSTCLSIAIAFASWHLVEKRALAWKKTKPETKP